MYLSTQSCSKRLGGGREYAMKLALDALLLQTGGGGGGDSPEDMRCEKSKCLLHRLKPFLFCRVPMVHRLVGKAEETSQVVRGVVSDLHPDMLELAQSFANRELRILVSEGGLRNHTPHSTQATPLCHSCHVLSCVCLAAGE